ncbi:hypothetical protein KAM435_38700 [Aquipseudomonas alcaligenes]|uniref:Uncharacterized protein n=1 Tax=Aquipseudomonas alcaligenes TaxID=43263 RepID=A0AA37CI35_AQUAC|nr:hypothetical protein KAM435_38700 [Pseudomonas alcaligenes]
MSRSLAAQDQPWLAVQVFSQTIDPNLRAIQVRIIRTALTPGVEEVWQPYW